MQVHIQKYIYRYIENDTTSTDHDKSFFPRMRQNPLHGQSGRMDAASQNGRLGFFWHFTAVNRWELSQKGQMQIKVGFQNESIQCRTNIISVIMTQLSCKTILKACWWSCKERRAFIVPHNEEICSLQFAKCLKNKVDCSCTWSSCHEGSNYFPHLQTFHLLNSLKKW